MRRLTLLLSSWLLAGGLWVQAAAPGTVTVKKGDTLYSLARAHGLSVEQLRALNNLKDNTIQVGQTLNLQKSNGQAVAAAKAPTQSSAVQKNAAQKSTAQKSTAEKPPVQTAPAQTISAQKPGVTKPAQPAVTPKSTLPNKVAAKPVAQAKPVSAGVYTVKSGDTLSKIAKQAGLTVDQFKRLNGLSSDALKVGQNLRLTGKIPPKVVKATPAKPAQQPKAYAVKTGDTLEHIAVSHGLSVAQLRRWNGLTGSALRRGQVLKLVAPSVSNPSVGKAVAVKPAVVSSNQGTYTVKGGDTLSQISSNYGVSVIALQTANNIQGTVITVGQKLRIPARGAKGIPSLPSGMEARTIYTYVRVKLRETPQSFASTYGTTPDVIRRLNGLSTLNQIVPGAKLLVPSRMAVPVPPRPARVAASFKQTTVDGIPVQIVQVDLRHRNVLVAPVLPSQGLTFGSGATVSALTSRSGANALVNGSYFHPQTYAPAGDIVMQGRLLTWGRIPAALAITPDNRASITGSTTALFGRPLDSTWNGMETVIASGPRIVQSGQVMSTYSNVFQDPAVFGLAARSAIGLISSRDLLMVSTHAKLSVGEMGRIMALLGSRDALLLDGGSSAGISFNGSTVLNSVRKVSYGIGVFTNYTGRRYAR